MLCVHRNGRFSFFLLDLLGNAIPTQHDTELARFKFRKPKVSLVPVFLPKRNQGFGFRTVGPRPHLLCVLHTCNATQHLQPIYLFAHLHKTFLSFFNFISTNTKLTQHSRYSSFTEQGDNFDRNLIFSLCNIKTIYYQNKETISTISAKYKDDTDIRRLYIIIIFEKFATIVMIFEIVVIDIG